ncbi:PEP/pyruvate-binding domain-containing protein [Pseudarthrobacter sp. NPDC058329]|uniref:PEP/pyruvate-binding domain-containing protein n=1 Tax=Pseudarthrobacter sp. NPDC058329 TaxID=3346448 RepID=UPI0036DF22E1
MGNDSRDDMGDDAGAAVSAGPLDRRLFPPLGGPLALTREAAGGKAAALSELKSAGFPVPPGFVVTRTALAARSTDGQAEWDREVRAAALAAGPGPYAVRSSAAAEDLPGASYAGMYESYLDVPGADLASAITRCFASANAGRVRTYRDSLRPQPAGGPGAGEHVVPDTRDGAPSDVGNMAVLVQQMVDAAAAGVAFTANPLTGARDETVISAVRGLGQSLVGGSEHGEEWVARGGLATRRSGAAAGQMASVLTRESATAVAALAGGVAGHFGCPQDIEWAVDRSGRVQLLQARPMTAVPEPVVWRAPGKGAWIRNFRLGEWLPEPVTPLFMDWVIPCMDAAYNDAVFRSAGLRVPMGNATVNGWYYVAPPTPRALPRLLLGGKPSSLPYFFNLVVRPMIDPAGADRAVLRDLEVQWRSQHLPAYRSLVDSYRDVPLPSSVAGLMDLVEQVARAAGQYLWFFAATGGAAWKMELVLARFWRRHLAPAFAVRQEQGLDDGGGYQVLLGGLAPALPVKVDHAVYSLDWYHPTAGEEPAPPAGSGSVSQGAAPAVARRRAAEAASRSVLRNTRHLTRFDTLLALAQHYALLREEQVRDFTLGWPLLRRCARAIGAQLQQEGVISGPDDVYFLTRRDLRRDAPPQHEAVAGRRGPWLRQRKLSAPLVLGTLPMLGNTFDRVANTARSTTILPQGALVGHPASPGRARGRVRVVEGAADFSKFQPFEVLVARATAPAWTPLFGQAAAVVTDGGNLAAHASLVAREYGIPAVVGTGTATQDLHTGQLVTVDGNAGIVVVHTE